MSFNYTKKLLVFLILIVIAVDINAKSFTQQIWNDNYPFYQKIWNLPFNKELQNGTLDEEVFKSYIIQDYFFLQNYRKVYGIWDIVIKSAG